MDQGRIIIRGGVELELEGLARPWKVKKNGYQGKPVPHGD